MSTEPGPGHGDSLHLEARLEHVPKGQGCFEAAPVARFRRLAISGDQRAVGVEVVGEVLGARIVVSPRELQQVVRQRLGALDLAEGDEHLADTDERVHLAAAVAEGAAEGEALLERRERRLVLARVVDQQPAEAVQRRGPFGFVA